MLYLPCEAAAAPFCQGKRVYTTTVAPLFWPPRSQGKKPYGVYHLGKPGKRGYTIIPERRAHTIEASDPEKEKRKVSTVVVCTFFFPVFVSLNFWVFGVLLGEILGGLKGTELR